MNIIYGFFIFTVVQGTSKERFLNHPWIDEIDWENIKADSFKTIS